MRYFKPCCKVKCLDTRAGGVHLKFNSSDGQELPHHAEVVLIPADDCSFSVTVVRLWYCIIPTSQQQMLQTAIFSVFQEDSSHRYL